jgi:hypothetical protein
MRFVCRTKIKFALVVLCLQIGLAQTQFVLAQESEAPSRTWDTNPIIGTWKLNVGKSKILQAKDSPKEITDVYRELRPDQIEFIRAGTQINGSSISSKWVWPREGGIAERKSPAPLPQETSYIEVLVDPGHWYVTILQNGKQNILMHKSISKDGKTMRLTIKSMDAQGKPVEQLQVFEKQ